MVMLKSPDYITSIPVLMLLLMTVLEGIMNGDVDDCDDDENKTGEYNNYIESSSRTSVIVVNESYFF